MLLFALLALLNPPQAVRERPAQGPRLVVDTLRIEPEDYQIEVASFGTVQARTQSRLVSQVSGEVIEVSPRFRDGGVFAKGEVLLQIDPRDYQASVQMARAGLLEAQQGLAQEQALSEQAQEDWARLGDGAKADALVLREPQLMAARAAVSAAEAELSTALLKLERTTIKAPFDGRILSIEVDLGEVVSANSELATLYASDRVEVRLPLANADLEFLQLPEPRAGGEEEGLMITVTSSLSGDVWQASLVRTEGAIDSDSQQLHVVAQIDDPFLLRQQALRDDGELRWPLKIGEYVTARIPGRVFSKQLVIPATSLYQGSYAYVVEGEVLQRRELDIKWRGDDRVLVAGGLKVGDELVLTTLGQVSSGTRVRKAGAGVTEAEAGVQGGPQRGTQGD